jgi:hypothetical protein
MYLHFANPVYLCVSYDFKTKEQFIVCRSLAIDRSLVALIELVTSENMLSEQDTIEITLPTYLRTRCGR